MNTSLPKTATVLFDSETVESMTESYLLGGTGIVRRLGPLNYSVGGSFTRTHLVPV